MIGLYSPAPQSGKSTVATALTTEHGFEQRGFATALKRMVIDLMYSAGIRPEAVGRYMDVDKEAPIPELGNKSFRYLTQTIGTDWGRYLVDKDLWIKVLLNSPVLPKLCVIDDLRFPNEYDAIRAAGGKCWRIYRPGQEATTDHPSEGLLEDREFDAQLTNGGTYEDLRAAVKGALLGVSNNPFVPDAIS